METDALLACLERELPHITRLLDEDVDATVADAELVVIGHGVSDYDRDAEWKAAGKEVLRLT